MVHNDKTYNNNKNILNNKFYKKLVKKKKPKYNQLIEKRGLIMFKGVLPEVAQKVGVSGALLLNQLEQLFLCFKKEEVFRTNEQLAEDLEHVISKTTIQRAKKRLLEEGYILVRLKDGIKRKTYYQLTEKAKKVLKLINKVKSFCSPNSEEAKQPNPPEKHKENRGGTPKSSQKPKDRKKFWEKSSSGGQPNYSANTPSMKKSFDEGFTGNKEAVGMPDYLKKLMGEGGKMSLSKVRKAYHEKN